MSQQSLFKTDGPAELPGYIGTNAKEVTRLAGQNLAMYQRLKEGPATNAELVEFSLKYTSRISDIRKWLGIRGNIKCERLDGGLTRYVLEEW